MLRKKPFVICVLLVGLLGGGFLYWWESRNILNNSPHDPIWDDIMRIQTQLQIYETINGEPPSATQGLQALVTPPPGEPRPRRWRQLMPAVPVDRWGMPYQYRYPPTRGQFPYEVFSCGEDRVAGTADDIGIW